MLKNVLRAYKKEKLKKLLLDYYKDVYQMQENFKIAMKQFDKLQTKLMEKVTRQAENADKLLEGLKKA